MKLSVIGCGNMASAIIGGLISKGIFEASNITASDKLDAARTKMKDTYHIKTIAENSLCIKGGDIVLLAVKPNVFSLVAPELKGHLENKLVISIMAGKTIEQLEEGLGKDVKIVRVMPNTPALVGEGMMAYCPNEKVKEEEIGLIETILSACGKVERVPESMMPVVTSLSGSSPAYVYMFIEAMADAAVADGMPRAQAYQFAAQTVLGSAKMVLETNRHPGDLKDMVCSPGGTTIEGVVKLEEKGFRSSVIEAVRACTDKAKKI
jgi:pyrroline-5-carboxylate reductase